MAYFSEFKKYLTAWPLKQRGLMGLFPVNKRVNTVPNSKRVLLYYEYLTKLPKELFNYLRIFPIGA
jgi:hypothetical protein